MSETEAAEVVESKAAVAAPITIKKYANRRLYNTATSSYVTLDHLCQMVKEGTEFAVFDAKSGEDITRQVLTQIIVEEEAKGENLLPISFLRQLISFYGHGLQWMVPTYLEHMMQSFAANQEKMTQAVQNTMFPFGGFEELSKQNMAMFERTMKMFSPFQSGEDNNSTGADGSGETAQDPGETPDQGRQLDALKRQVDLLQAQLETLSKEAKGSKKG